MANIFRKPYEIKLPAPDSEFEEFGPGKEGVGLCRRCLCFYYGKSWHHHSPALDWERRKEEITVKLVLCPACIQVREHEYEGEVLIKNIPQRLDRELINLITSYGDRAFRADCQHRLLIISKRKDSVRVTTTENQLAVRLAKKIKDAFKKFSSLKISYSSEPQDVERVVLVFA